MKDYAEEDITIDVALENVREAIPFYIPKGGDLEKSFLIVLAYAKDMWDNFRIRSEVEK